MQKGIIVCCALAVCLTIAAQTPAWEFGAEPVELTESYYDYMPGGCWTLPVQTQSAGLPGDNSVYITFHAQPTVTGERFIYLAHIAPGGNVFVMQMGNDSLPAGFSAIDIDPETNDPMFVWHADYDQDGFTDIIADADLWHQYQEPGHMAGYKKILPPNGVDFEGLWPSLYAGFGRGAMRNVFVFTRSNIQDGTLLYLARAEYDTADIEAGSFDELDGTYDPVPYFEDWLADTSVENVRHYETLASDSIVVVCGYQSRGEATVDELNEPDLFFLVNRHYGEGDWELHMANSEQWIPDDPNDMFMKPLLSSNSSCYADGGGRFHLPLYYQMCHLNQGEMNYYSNYTCLRDVVFDLADNSIAIHNLWPQTDDGSPFFPASEDDFYWPVYWHSSDNFFHENNIKITGNKELGLLCAVWSDGTNARRWHYLNDDDYADWAEVPSIAVSVSGDNGASWSEPILLNALETPELAGMIPCYVYPGDHVKYMGEGTGRVHLMFYDDNSYGSYALLGNGANMGGTLRYMALDIDFGIVGNPECDVPAAPMSLANSPNPFNPETNIRFSLPASGEVELCIYNILGQRVRTLARRSFASGEHNVIWNGTDDNGDPVGSGVYFARMVAKGGTRMRKLLLLK